MGFCIGEIFDSRIIWADSMEWWFQILFAQQSLALVHTTLALLNYAIGMSFEEPKKFLRDQNFGCHFFDEYYYYEWYSRVWSTGGTFVLGAVHSGLVYYKTQHSSRSWPADWSVRSRSADDFST